MLSATLNLILAVSSSMPPLLVTIEGDIRIQTPNGPVIVIPEGSTFTVSDGIRLRESTYDLYLDNRGIFKDGFE